MSKRNKKAMLAICTMFLLLFTGCNNSSGTSQGEGTTENNISSNNDSNSESSLGDSNVGDSTTVDSTTENSTTENSANVLATDIVSFTGDYSDKAINAEWSISDSTQITMNGDQVQTSGSGIDVAGSNITITKGGTYVFSGTLNDGTILVDVPEEDNVQLVLNG